MTKAKMVIPIRSDEIRKRLKEIKLTQLEVAKILKINKDYLNSCLRKGEMVPGMLAEIATILNVPPAELTAEEYRENYELLRSENQVLREALSDEHSKQYVLLQAENKALKEELVYLRKRIEIAKAALMEVKRD